MANKKKRNIKKNKKKTLKKKSVKKANNKKSKNKNILKLIIPILITIAVIAVAVSLVLHYTPEKDAAKVNGVSISEKQLEQNYNLIFFLSGYPEELKTTVTKEMYLNQLINEELLLQDAVKNDIKVTDEEVNSYIQDSLVNANITQEELKAKLSENGFSLDDLSNYYNRQLTILALGEAKLFPGIEVTPEEVDKYYNENKNQFESNLSVSEIKDAIKNFLFDQKKQVKFAEYIETLRNSSDIENYLESVNQQNLENELDSIEQETNATEEEISSLENKSCFDKYNLSSDTVIFYHADWCKHCNDMKPVVEELEAEGYNFLWAESSSGKNIEVVKKCFSDVLTGAVPEFICAGSKDYKLGEQSKEKLKEFADNCK